MFRKLIFFILAFLLHLSANAQLKVAILPATDKAGDVKYAVKMMLSASLTSAISDTEGYEAYDRIDLSAVLDEQSFQRTGMVSDQEIQKIGEMTGATFVLVTEAAPMDETCIVATAKIVNVESARIENSSVAIISVDPRQMENDCKQLTDKLLKIGSRSNTSVVSTPVNKPVPQQSNQSYVDLGLSVKWATCNLGASVPEEYGLYFAWGETQPKRDYSRETYKWYDEANKIYLKYYTKYDKKDGKRSRELLKLDMEDDASAAMLGGKWRLPTSEEWEELLGSCKMEWIENSSGYKVTSLINGNSIFLPASGYRLGTSLLNVGESGLYWSSTYYKVSRAEIDAIGCNIFIIKESKSKYNVMTSKGACRVYEGLTIRPVMD